MIRFEDLKVNRYLPGKIGLTWKVFDDDGKYYIFIQRSGSPEGPFESLNKIPFTNTYGFVDTAINRDNPFRIIYYRLLAVDKQTNQEIFSDVSVTTDTKSTWLGKAIAKEERLYLERFVGDTSLLFIRKSFGKRCPKCWDKVRGKNVFENCDACWGTTYEGGFFEPIRISVQYNVIPKATSKSEVSVQPAKNSNAWTSNYPIVSKGDMLINIEGNNDRFLIDDVNFTRDKLGPIRQIMQIVKIDNSNILNKIPIDEKAPSIDDVNVFRRG